MELKALEISCGPFDVLVNSQQFVSSVALSAEAVESGSRYLDRVAQWKGAQILVFDLAGYLGSILPLSASEDTLTALLSDTSCFSEAHRDAYRSLAGRVGRVSADHLALSVRATLRLDAVPLAELKQVPPAIRGGCRKQGLLAFRFVQDRIQYLMDIETVLFTAMAAQKRSRQ